MKSRNLINATLFIVALVSSFFAQRSLNGPAPSALAIGSPAGSYSISGIDNVNLFSGRVNINIPLVEVGGRGEAGYTMVAPINYGNWVIEPLEVAFGNYINIPAWKGWDNYMPSFGPGGVSGTTTIDECASVNDATFMLTRFIFTGPDGSQTELLDTNSNGIPHQESCVQDPDPHYNRGTIFRSVDGSNLTFISDSTVYDKWQWGGPNANGYLIFPNGTRYRIDNSGVSWIQDRNGNKTTFNVVHNSATSTLTATDSNGRTTTVTFEHVGQANVPWAKVEYKGTGGETRTIKVFTDSLSNALASGETLQEYGELFPDTWGGPAGGDANTGVITRIELPDSRDYEFKYNSYSEPARITLPTGGAIEYTHGSAISNLATGGLVDLYWDGNIGTAGFMRQGVYRRVVERREYPDGGTGNNFSARTVYGGEELACGYEVGFRSALNYKYSGTSTGTLIGSTRHYYEGAPCSSLTRSVHDFGNWDEGREWKTIVYDASDNALRTVEHTWDQGDGAPYSRTWFPRIEETKTTLNDTSLVSKVTHTHDSSHRLTDTYEYDYGSPSAGSLLRRSHTDFVSDSNYTTCNSSTSRCMRTLPSQTWISSDSSGNDIVSRTQFEYDNYSNASEHPQHDPLMSRSSVTGYNSTDYGTGFAYRGNVTAVTSYTNADAETGGVTAYSFYDVLGNMIKTRDARGKESVIYYDDNFGAADTDVTTNTDPTYEDEEEVTIYPLDGVNTFAFATSMTNPMGWTSYVQYDYFTGKPVNKQDVNEMKSKMLYEDALDRLTQTVTALTVTGSQAQTTIEYDDDSDRQIIVSSDLNDFDDNLLKTVSRYDGLGRTFETRTYEADGNYRAVETKFDALGRPYKVSNPFRSGDTKYWTETTFDALGRPTQTETLDDDAKVITAYDGNRTIVTDQAGKQRISLTDALGRLKDIWEVRPSSDGATVSVTFPGGAYSGVAYGYKTSYGYDALGNLISVDQGAVDRSFAYDGLSRVTSATNPESGEVLYDYDANGNLVERRDARGIVTTFTYDDLNRVTAKAYATPSPTPANYQNTPSVAYTYDNLTNSKGHLTKVETSVSTTEYTEFDILGRVLKSKQTTDGTTYGNGSTDSQMTYTYNLAGALIEQQYPSGRRVQNVLDNDGQLEMVKSRKNSNSGYWAYANNFTYLAAGAVKSMQLGNGTWESTVFNNRLQPTQIALGTVQNGYDKLKLNYSYGDWVSGSIVGSKNNGNIVQQAITVPNSTGHSDAFTATQKYYYDSLNRIDDSVETISGETWQQDFDYDRYGNRTFVEANTDFHGFDKLCSGSMCSDLKKRMNPGIGSANRLSTSDGYAFDSAGNTKTDPDDRQFIYDGENKQVKVLDDEDETIGQYWYDGDGKRVKKYAPSSGPNPGETTVFVYDAFGKLIAEYSVDIETTNAKVAYVTNDHLGSPRINTDKNGSVAARHDYHPFGENIVTDSRNAHAEYVADKVRKQFTGYEGDNETGLDFAQARYSNSGLGRFTSPDPHKIVAEIQFDNNEAAREKLLDYLSMPQQWNRYTYAINSPFKYTDPTGRVIYLTGNTIEERNEALQRLRGMLGEERFKYLKGRMIKVDGKVVMEISVSDGNAAKMAKIGTDADSKSFSAGMARMLNDKANIFEFQVVQDDAIIPKKNGDAGTIREHGGGIMLGSNDSQTGNAQIFVARNAAQIATDAFARRDTSFSSIEGTHLKYHYNSIIDAHEFGHGYGNVYGIRRSWKTFEDAARKENCIIQFRTKHDSWEF